MAKTKLTDEQRAERAAAKAAKKAASTKSPELFAGLTTKQIFEKYGSKGVLRKVSLTALKLARVNDYAGVEAFNPGGAPIEKKNDKARKAAGNKIQPKWSPKGSLWNAPAESEVILRLRSLAKAASGDVAKMEYSSAVKEFLQASATSGGEGGTRSFSTEGLADAADML